MADSNTENSMIKDKALRARENKRLVCASLRKMIDSNACWVILILQIEVKCIFSIYLCDIDFNQFSTKLFNTIYYSQSVHNCPIVIPLKIVIDMLLIKYKQSKTWGIF